MMSQWQRSHSSIDLPNQKPTLTTVVSVGFLMLSLSKYHIYQLIE